VLLWGTCSLAFAAVLSACGTPYGYLTYENKTEIPVFVTMTPFKDTNPSPCRFFSSIRSYDGPVAPGNQEKIGYASYVLSQKNARNRENFLITAVDADLNLIYQRLHSWDEMNDGNWIAVIEPMPIDPGSLGEVAYENRTGLPIRAHLLQVDLQADLDDYQYGYSRYRYAGGEIQTGRTKGFSYYGIPFHDSEQGSRYKYRVIAVEENDPQEDMNLLFRRLFTWDELNDAGWHVVIDPALSD
jgi:hypothetical protein